MGAKQLLNKQPRTSSRGRKRSLRHFRGWTEASTYNWLDVSTTVMQWKHFINNECQYIFWMFLMNHILPFGLKAPFESHSFKPQMTIRLNCTPMYIISAPVLSTANGSELWEATCTPFVNPGCRPDTSSAVGTYLALRSVKDFIKNDLDNGRVDHYAFLTVDLEPSDGVMGAAWQKSVCLKRKSRLI